MLRLHRVPLPGSEKIALEELQKLVQGDGDDKKKRARELFKNERQKNLFQIVTTALKHMNKGSQLCFYCLHDRGVAVDHFCPIDHNPDKTFDWENYLWSCTACNSLEKNRDFPLGEDDEPLLLNPVEEDPYPYLPLNELGRFIRFEEVSGESDQDCGMRLKNNKTLEVLGLNVNEALVNARKSGWEILESLLPLYQNGDQPERLKYGALIRDSPLVLSVLASMLHTFSTSDEKADLLGPELCDCFQACPEFQDWINPTMRAAVEELEVIRELLEKRLIQVEALDQSFCLTFEGGGEVLTTAENAREAQGLKLINVFNDKGRIVFHFYGAKLSAPLSEWVFNSRQT